MYKVPKAVYGELKKWKNNMLFNSSHAVFIDDLDELSSDVCFWLYHTYSDIEGDYVLRDDDEINNLLIAIIRWVGGEDTIEAEKPKKWVVRSKDSSESGVYVYLRRIRAFGIITTEGVSRDYATKFDTKKEAESWANAHQEVIEVDE